MNTLPSLNAGERRWKLPLSPATRDRLVALLLEDDAERRQAAALRALEEDPVLTLWVVCRMERLGQPAPASFHTAAAWFSSACLSALDWRETPPFISVSAETIDRWGNWAARAVAVTRLVRCLTQGDSTEYAEAVEHEAPLLGMLHAADEAMTLAIENDAASESSEEPSGLPSWLGERIRDVRGDIARSGHTGSVPLRQAVAAWNESNQGNQIPADVWQQALSEHERVRGIWLKAIQQAGAFGTNGSAPTPVLPILAERLRRLAALESRFDQTLENEKLAALRQLAYGASHEINNPLANISTRAQTLLREESDPERRRKLATINAQAFRAHEMISDMMLFAKPPRLQLEQVDVPELLGRVVRELSESATAQGTELLFARGDLPVPAIEADPTHLAEALQAMCRNSLEALQTGGWIELSVDADERQADGGQWLRIQVADNGPGIGPEVRRHLFDPYFSGREAGRGLGLGLSKCWTIVRLHGGSIDVASEPRRGTTFTIHLPLHRTAESHHGV